jgi:hypothetical protein
MGRIKKKGKSMRFMYYENSRANNTAQEFLARLRISSLEHRQSASFRSVFPISENYVSGRVSILASREIRRRQTAPRATRPHSTIPKISNTSSTSHSSRSSETKKRSRRRLQRRLEEAMLTMLPDSSAMPRDQRRLAELDIPSTMLFENVTQHLSML